MTATGNLAGSSLVLDMVGYGSTPTSFEAAPTGTATAVGTSVSRAAGGADSDSNAADFAAPAAPSPTAASGDTTGPVEEPSDGDATIAEIQGTGDTSPLDGDEVTTQGVITAMYPGTLNGFYIQTGGTGDGQRREARPTPSSCPAELASATHGLQIRDTVEVTGTVSEFNGATQLTASAAGSVTELDEPLAAVTALETAYPTTVIDREAHEGELLAPTDTFTVTNTFATNTLRRDRSGYRYEPLLQPTESPSPALPGRRRVVDNAARGVALDDGSTINFTLPSVSVTPVDTRSRGWDATIGPRSGWVPGQRSPRSPPPPPTTRDPRLPQQRVEVPAAEQVTNTGDAPWRRSPTPARAPRGRRRRHRDRHVQRPQLLPDHG